MVLLKFLNIALFAFCYLNNMSDIGISVNKDMILVKSLVNNLSLQFDLDVLKCSEILRLLLFVI